MAEDDNWEDLTPVLTHILDLVPYKRADVKLVCRAWRDAVNRSLRTVSIPASDLALLHYLPAIRHLSVKGAAAAGHLHPTTNTHSTWPPSAGPAAAHAGAAAAAAADHSSSTIAAAPHSTVAAVTPDDDGANTCAGYGGSSLNPWLNAKASTLQRLLTLRLADCPQEVEQLADWQLQQTENNISSGSRPGLEALQLLELSGLGCLSLALPLLLGTEQQQVHLASSSKQAQAPVVPVRPLAHLERLLIHSCSFDQPHLSQLSMLPQLPVLRVLQLSDCELQVLPAAVCDCEGLTRLHVTGSRIQELPQEISRLQSLQVLDVSNSSHLQSLGISLSSLTGLTELNLAGPNGLWSDYSQAAALEQEDAATAQLLHSSLGGVTPANSSSSAQAARAALPLTLRLPALSHEQQLQLLPEVADLRRLSKLTLSSNRTLRVLPVSLAHLTQLQVLDARGCSLQWLDDGLWECAGLQQLLLGDNVLGDLPDGIGRLHNLEVLDVGSCRSLWQLPRALLSLNKLTRLVLSTKAVGQHVVEQLELRANPVEVEFDPLDSDSDSDDGLPDSDGADLEFPPELVAGSLPLSDSEGAGGASDSEDGSGYGYGGTGVGMRMLGV